VLAGVVLAVCGVGTALGQPESEWHKTHEESGIVVSTRSEPGDAVTTFRGQGEVKGGLVHLLAILLDDVRSKEWAKGVTTSKVLRNIDAQTAIVYSYSAQPWPVKDRDLVLKRTFEVLGPGQLKVRLVCLPEMPSGQPESESALRVKRCETVILLRKVDAATTYVDYRVMADPGGNNPGWIVRWVSKNLPLDTLRSLREQVKRTKGKYQEFERTWGHIS
jgi:hypothetical protein